jgi:hypothetical protein
MLKTTHKIPADFESYLMDLFSVLYPAQFDDDMPDSFDRWLGEMEREDLIKRADLFAAAKHRQGIIEGMVETQNIALDVIKRVSL